MEPPPAQGVTREEFDCLCRKVDVVLHRVEAIYALLIPPPAPLPSVELSRRSQDDRGVGNGPEFTHAHAHFDDSCISNAHDGVDVEIAEAQFSNHTYPAEKPRKKRHKRPKGSQDDGQVSVTLGKVDLCQLVEETASIEEPKKDALGEICFSLRYVPQKSQLTVVILECKNLKKMDIGGLSDPYVKIAIMQSGKRIKKSKTTIKMHTLNPYYNESFKFDVAPNIMPKVQLILTVVDYDRVGSNDVIGKVTLGQGVGGNSQKHWMEVIEKPRRSIAQWHNLMPIEEAKK